MRLPAPLPLLVAAAVGVAACTGGPAEVVVGTPAPSAPASTRAPSPEVEAAAEPTPTPTPTPAPWAALARRLATIADDPRYAVDGSVAISVLDGSGAVVFERHADVPLVPASTAKLVTAAAALAALGPDFRYLTRVTATAAIGGDGTLDGDLVLVGSGDPTLSTPVFDEVVWPDRPDTPMAALADELVRSGLRRVTGAVLGDPSVFAPEGLADGWIDRYLYDLDATYVSGLTVNAGRRLQRRDGRLHGIPVPDPAAEAAARLKGLLEERGVVVAGTAASTRTPPPARLSLAEVESVPMRDLLAWMVQQSDNHAADAIFRTVGVARRAGDTWAAAGRAVTEVLDVEGLDWSGVVLADGSGLSRSDRLSAGLLARLDAVMTISDVGGSWRSLMAVAGESGTLRRRLRGTVAEGAFRGKTGTLDDVRAVVGSVDGPDGDRFHLAVVGNVRPGTGSYPVRVLQDEVVLALAEHLRGCVREPLPAPSSPDPLAPPPYRLVCR